MGEDKFYIVNERSLPEIFKKVIEVKENIELGNAKDISEAIKLVGISRSTYYKYKVKSLDFVINKDSSDTEICFSDILEDDFDTYEEVQSYDDCFNAFKKASNKHGINIFRLLLLGYKQIEIRSILGISQPTISRIINKAYELYTK